MKNGSDSRGTKTRNLLVCLSSSGSNSRVIHAAQHLAAAYGARWTALFVETPDYVKLSEEDRKRLRSNMQLAERLGAHLETVVGTDIAYQIAEYARQHDITSVIIGQGRTVSSLLFRRQTLTDRLVAYAPNLEYHIIPDLVTNVYIAKKAHRYPVRRTLLDIGLCLLALLLATLIGFLFSHLGFTDANIIMVYLLGLLFVSITTSHRVYSLVWAVVSVLLFDLLFTTPRFSFRAYGTGYPVTFLVMFIAAFLISTQAIRLKENARLSAETARRTGVVVETDRALSKAASREEIWAVLVQQLSRLLRRSIVIYRAEKGRLGEPEFSAYRPEDTYSAETERPAAERAFQENRRTGATTGILPKADCLYYSLRVQDRVYGVVGISIGGNTLDASEQSVALSVIGECSLALENEQNAREKEQSAMLAERERLQANILRAVSHDLRTPLTSISGNADNLLSVGESLSRETRRQIYTDIYEDAQWLNSMVENLLSAGRLEEKGAAVRRGSELVDELIAEAVSRLGRRAAEHEICVPDSGDLIFIDADARLIVQVLVNLLDNALKYTPEGSRITVTREREGGMARIRIADNGPGISDEDKEHIFEMFYTGSGHSSDSRRGLGLGLALCRSIVLAHNGNLTVRDNEPKGTVFEMSLPVSEVETNE